MGTSGTREPLANVLVPTFVDEPPTQPAVPDPGNDEAGENDVGTSVDSETDAGSDAGEANHVPYPEIPSSTGLSLSGARGNLTYGSRASDPRAIRRGAGQYVYAGEGGAEVARSMRGSRMVASGVAGLAGTFANRGPVEALRHFNLEALSGEPAEDVFVALTDVLCPPGSTIEEAIARDAMLETVAAFAAEGVGSFDGLTAEQLQEFFIGVVSRSIEGKILNEVGTRTVHLPIELSSVERAQRMLHEFIEGCVRDRFEEAETDLAELDSEEIDVFVGDLYASALDLVQVLGEST